MINVKLIIIYSLISVLGLSLSACNTSEDSKESAQETQVNDSFLTTAVDSSEESSVSSDSDSVMPVTDSNLSVESLLDKAEQHHLIFMREEEKLARDVYISLYGMWSNSPIFMNIGEGSEQTHTDIIRDKLEEFNLADPNPSTNVLPSSIGVFTGELYGSYFADKYQSLINRGSQSELEALYVGAFIEELDMHDIVECPDIIVETDNGINDCGLDYTNEEALINAYSTLLDGSKNHLKAFVGRIESIIGEGNYEAQILSQDEINEILGR